jgi:phosphoglycerol transferase MdoB-like AlkP superfamily enzyme
MYKKLPQLIRFLIIFTGIEVVIFTLFRGGFLYFAQFQQELLLSDIVHSFWIGFRFDLQLAILILMPVFLLAGIPFIGIFKSRFGKYFWLIYLVLANVAAITIYVINFAYFDFFKVMVDNTIVQFFYDIGEAWNMAVESYPVYPAILVTLVVILLAFWLLQKLYHSIPPLSKKYSKKTSVAIYTAFTAIFIFGGYGKFELYPWRWSEAFWSPNTYLSALSSNPITYFVNTLKNTDEKFNTELAQHYYDTVAEFLEVNPKDPKKETLARRVTPNHAEEYTFNKPNIVFILGESTSYARSSISGNPLNPTPFIKYMSDHGLTYTNYYTPHSGTARSVWASTTGMADVERMKTSSRNPMIVNQHMILNSLHDYKKFYFIGGSLSWGNIRGVLSNIKGLITREEASYASPHNDVWGISDAHLAGEVNSVLKHTKEPFFAFVQLAGNHSPNTIPDENFGFAPPKEPSKTALLQYGFDGIYDEFVGQAFLDHSVKRLITLAEKEQYFDNTIFIFVGDHGLPRRADHVHEAEQTYKTHTLHTPLVLYAPKLIQHKRIDYPVSELDIMATIAGLSGEHYTNATFGRDLLDKDFATKPHYAFYLSYEENPTINLIGEEYIVRIRANGDDPRLFKYYYNNEEKGVNYYTQKPELAQKMTDLVRGIYEMTRFVRYHNSSEKVESYFSQSEH